MAGVALKQISKSFGANTILRPMDLEIRSGEFLVLLGPSGCGKSTLLRIIAGLERPDSGQVLIDGKDVTSLEPQHRNIAMVFQSYALYPHLTVRENMGFALKNRKESTTTIEKKVKDIAELLNLESYLDRKPRELSGGQRQRVALGRALVRETPVILFDEPLSNLDAHLRAQMRIEIKKIHNRLKNTMIYVTHDQVEATTMGDRVAILNKGRLEQVGTPIDVYNRPATKFIAEFIGSPEINFFDGANSDKRFIYGIRPENLMLGSGPYQGRVLLTENLGSQSLVHIESSLGAFRVLRQSQDSPALGENLSFNFDTTKLIRFDRETGERALDA